MEVRLYDEDIIQILSNYFKVPENYIDVFEDNGVSWFAITPKKSILEFKNLE